MIKSIVRKSLSKQGPSSLEVRGIAGVAPNSKNKSGTVYSVLREQEGKAKVCVIRRLGGIGDVLMCTPALRQIKADFPQVELTFAIDMHSTSGNIYFELVKNAPFIDHIVDARFVKQTEYDAVVDISSVCIRHEHSGLPSLNRIDIFSRACGLPRLVEKRSWYAVEESEREWAKKVYDPYRTSGKKIVVLHTASMEGKRCWPIEKYIAIVEAGIKDNLPIQFIVLDFNNCFDKWHQYTNCHNASRTSLREMAALIEQADLFIGPDSGPMHLAGAIGTPSIITFGSIPPEARINYYPSHESVRMDSLACIGCWYKPCPYNVRCMKELDYLLVYNKMRRKINV
jgi:ADP-heptose:LPS heptosyltransferase